MVPPETHEIIFLFSFIALALEEMLYGIFTRTPQYKGKNSLIIQGHFSMEGG
jgi:hypothetical protein